jgi:thiamine pyrophosphokinase
MKSKDWNLASDFNQLSKTALIILNQPIPSKLIKDIWHKVSIRICADGGANRLMQLNLIPDKIVGDLDSLHEDARTYYSNVEIIHLEDQDTNDFEKCIQLINDTPDIDQILAVGALGGRFDHQMANISTLYKYSRMKIYLISFESIVFLLEAGRHSIDSCLNDMFKINCGLLPMKGAAVVKTSGLKWDLDETFEFEFGKVISTSNRFDKETVTIDTNVPIIFTQELELKENMEYYSII